MKKNILILSYRDSSGDGIAAVDLSKCLIDLGHNVLLMVLVKTRTEPFIIQPIYDLPNIWSKLYKKISNKFLNIFFKSPNIETDPKFDFFINQEKEKLTSDDTILRTLPFTPNLILACGIRYFVNTTTLYALKQKTNAKIYMVMIDMFPLTGGCHHAWDCKGYQSECKECPAIIDNQYKKIANENLIAKADNVKASDINILALSGRTFEQAKSSTLFKNQTIYNINSFIDLAIYNRSHRSQAKSIFGIQENYKVILAGSEFTYTERKGLKYFIQALNHLSKSVNVSANDVIILIIGNDKNSKEALEKIPFKKKFIDYIKDERLLSLAYQAADIFVCASIEDPGPRMVSQALACGTPVVGFEMGVLYNLVRNDYNGYKAILKDELDLANGIEKILLLTKEQYENYSKNAAKEIEEFSSLRTIGSVINQIFDT